jgi:hypothetical protein
MLLLYEAKVREEITRTRALAQRLRDKFKSRRVKAAELLQDRALVKDAYEQLLRALPPEVTAVGNAERHLHFMEYYLVRNEIDKARKDSQDICDFDLPELEEAFQQWCGSLKHYDPALSDKVKGLLIEARLDSALRAAFVLLTERLVTTFQASSELDGSRLVNDIFGAKGRLTGKILDPDREAMRNLLDGLYGVARNPLAHSNTKVETKPKPFSRWSTGHSDGSRTIVLL